MSYLNKFTIFTLFLVVFSAAFTMFYDLNLWNAHLAVVHEDPYNAGEVSKYLVHYFQEPEYILPVIPWFTPAELQHLLDVKIRMCFVYYLVPIAWIVWLYILLKGKNKSENLFKGGLVSLSSLLVGLIPFPLLFVIFHGIFFPQGNWIFPPDHMIVQIYPPHFWFLMAKTLAARIFILSSAFIVVGKARILERLL